MVSNLDQRPGLDHPYVAAAQPQDLADLDFVHWASLASSSLSAIYVIAGIQQLIRGDRAVAFRRFERAFLIAIFVTCVFTFYESQFAAALGLGLNILMLVTFNKMAATESARDPAVGAGT